MEAVEDNLPSATSIPDNADHRAKHRATYSSFGRDGLTASANAYGHLLQITQYFGNEPSGFVSVDLATTTEPHFIAQRASDLQSQSEDPTKGIRLLFEKASNISECDIWETEPRMLRSLPTKTAMLVLEPNQMPIYDLPVSRTDWASELDLAPTVEFVHNRWPRFTAKTPAFDIDIQYYIADKTVYQTYTFTSNSTEPIPSEIPRLVIHAGLLLRDLDFSGHDPQNARNLEHLNYTHYAPEGGNCVIRMHKNSVKKKNNQDSIALFISPFINGHQQQPHYSWQASFFESYDDYIVTPNKEAKDSIANQNKLEITMAYTLKLVSSNGILDETSPVSEKDLRKATEALNERIFGPISVVKNTHLDFALNRNLEHILSVCSVPIRDSRNGKIPAIALTCGDISGHRVAGAASFYAFQFLLSAYQFFDKKLKGKCPCQAEDCLCEENMYSLEMRNRILRICWGHLKWIFQEADEDETFSLHNWASGQAIDSWKSGQSQSRKSLIDGSFNITKVADFYDKAATDKQKPLVMEELKSVVSEWIENLHRNNQNYEYVFPHSTTDEPLQFQLADHAMIWRTLKSLEKLGFKSELCIPDIRRGRHNISYSSTKIQNSIFRKFTTPCTQLGEQMVATSRNLSENSFLLQIDDTATLYAANMGLFDRPTAKGELIDKSNDVAMAALQMRSDRNSSGDSFDKSDYMSADAWDNKIDSWKATINSQALHEDNDDAIWDHPLQFALAMIFSSSKRSINSRSATTMHKYATSMLLQTSSQNGLFPGQFDENQEPIIFSDDHMQDSYWHATFEIPYILWNYHREHSSKNKRNKVSSFPSPPLSRSSTDELYNGASYVKKIEPFVPTKDETSDSALSYEWLHMKPKFFDFRIDLSPAIIEDFCDEYGCNKGSKSSEPIGRVATAAAAAAKKAAEKAAAEAAAKEEAEALGSPAAKTADASNQEFIGEMGYIIDVSGIEYNRSLGQRAFGYNVFSPESIRWFIGGARDVTNAKKRFFHFFRANLGIALNCYLASSEREEMSSFLDKHASYSKHFFEDTTTIFNKWVTELHLSFYQVVSDDRDFQIIPSKETFEFPNSTAKVNTKRVGRAVMSFRIDGDLFDHYWTCHFFDYNPQWMASSQGGRPFINKTKIKGTMETDPWHQRRILELVLFDMILEEMVQGSKGLVQDIMASVLGRAQLDNHNTDMDPTIAEFSDIDASTLLRVLEALFKVDSNTFALKNDVWNKFQRILQVIEDDLMENLEMISLWTKREEKRRANRLQWTPRRAQKYQGAISKLKLSNGHKIHELNRCLANVASFNKLLTRRLEVMRNDLETRSNVDVRLFTYVTVVFLPISFATSVFSMSGAPTKETLGSMASTAGVALVVTVVALLNAKTLDAELFRPILQSIRLQYPS